MPMGRPKAKLVLDSELREQLESLPAVAVTFRRHAHDHSLAVFLLLGKPFILVGIDSPTPSLNAPGQTGSDNYFRFAIRTERSAGFLVVDQLLHGIGQLKWLPRLVQNSARPLPSYHRTTQAQTGRRWVAVLFRHA
jgi:hypothetical protein